jgi:CheY-like chemotaxis protein
MAEAQQAPPDSRRVLVVDDYRDGADIAAFILERAGHIVNTAYGCRDALAIAAWFKPEVAVLDIAMPDMDGHELAERLRALPGVKGCRMVALTGQDDSATREKSNAAGFCAHLVKPAKRGALLRAVQGDGNDPPNAAWLGITH